LWIKKFGPIPDGLRVLHHCDNGWCINFDHVFLGTPKDNTQDMLRKGRHWVQKGENHYRCKLTDAQVKEIKELYVYRDPTKEHDSNGLARKYGVSPSLIKAIVTYGHRNAG